MKMKMMAGRLFMGDVENAPKVRRKVYSEVSKVRKSREFEVYLFVYLSFAMPFMVDVFHQQRVIQFYRALRK